MLYSVEDVKHTPPIVRNALRKMRAAEAIFIFFYTTRAENAVRRGLNTPPCRPPSLGYDDHILYCDVEISKI